MRKCTVVLLLIVVAAWAGGVWAKDELPPGSVQTEESWPGIDIRDSDEKDIEVLIREIEEMVVTAQKRRSTLRDTAISMSVFGAQTIDMLGISNAQDLTNFTPNVSIGTGSKGTNFFVTSRGISMGDVGNLSRDSATAIYVDGVYSGMTIGNLIDVTDLERIEVLRGPQGDLYGRNANGGAINFLTRKPSGTWGSKASLQGGNEGRIDFRGAIDFPVFGDEGFVVDEKFGALSGMASFATLNQTSAFYENSAGPDVQDESRLVGRLVIRYVNEHFEADYSYDRNYIDEQGPEMQMTKFYPGTRFLDGTLPVTPGFTSGVNMQPYESHTRSDRRDLNGAPQNDTVDLQSHSLTMAYEFEDLGCLGSATLKSITGYRSSNAIAYNDSDGTPFSVFETRTDTEQDQVTQELNFIGGNRYDWGQLDYTIGYFYFYEQGESLDYQLVFLDSAFDGIPTGLPPPNAILDLGQRQDSRPEIDNQAHAVYGHWDYTPPILDDRIALEFGVRYTYENRGIAKSITSGPTLLTRTTASKTFDAVTPKGTVRARVTDELNAYFTISRGFTSGGFNARANSADPNALTYVGKAYKPEFVTNFEGGLKFRGLNNRVGLNVAAFFMDYKDMQRTFLRLEPGPPLSITTGITNVGEAEIAGMEIQLQTMPIDNLMIDATYGLTSAEYIEFIDFIPGGGGAQRNFADERAFATTPKHNFSVGVQYWFTQLEHVEIVPRIDYYWQDETCFQNCDNPDADQNAYGLLSARLSIQGYELPRNMGTLSAIIWGQNLLDRSYATLAIDFNTNTAGTFSWITKHFGKPRTFGGTLIWRFGSFL